MSHNGRRVGVRLYTIHNMAGEPSVIVSAWRNELPALAGRAVTLREPGFHDLGALIELLSLGDATRFGVA